MLRPKTSYYKSCCANWGRKSNIDAGCVQQWFKPTTPLKYFVRCFAHAFNLTSGEWNWNLFSFLLVSRFLCLLISFRFAVYSCILRSCGITIITQVYESKVCLSDVTTLRLKTALIAVGMQHETFNFLELLWGRDGKFLCKKRSTLRLSSYTAVKCGAKKPTRYSSHWHCSHYEVTLHNFRIANWFVETSNNYFFSSWTMTFSWSFLGRRNDELKENSDNGMKSISCKFTDVDEDVSQQSWAETKNFVNRFQIIRLFIE